MISSSLKFQRWFIAGMWNRLDFLWKRKHLEERSWKRKQTRNHLTFWRAGSIFHKTWGRDVEADAAKF